MKFQEQAKLLGFHPGEIGTGRENALKNFLRQYIPRRYAVDSGFLFDASGNDSDQIDVVIYEADYTPVFEVIDGMKYFPCETVVAVGQVKTEIGSQKVMQDCLENIKSVKELDRSNKRTNLPITGPGISQTDLVKFNPDENFRDQIFGFIFCSRSIKKDLMIEELRRFNKENERKLWTNLIVNYNEFLIEYENELLTQDTMTAKNGVVIDISKTPQIFAIFISILNNFLNMAHIARPNLFDYCKLSAIEHSGFDLTEP